MGYSFRNFLTVPLPETGLKVEVVWVSANQESMEWNRCLYLYQSADGSIYYIGKAYRDTVGQRRQCHADEGLITIGGLIEPSQRLTIMVGLVSPPIGRLLTDSLISDVEALLIREVQPTGNTVVPNVSRDDLEVTCSGIWPLAQTVFTNLPLSVFMSGLLGDRR